jgi:hypothetical protein
MELPSASLEKMGSYHSIKNTKRFLFIDKVNHIWLVVLTILKNISQWGGLSHILWKIKHVPNHQPNGNLSGKSQLQT